MSSKSSKNGSDSSKMDRSSTTTSDSGFWTTIDLLMEREWKNKRGSWESEEDKTDAASTDLRTLIRRGRLIRSNKVNPGGSKFSKLVTKLIHFDDTQEETVPTIKLSLWATPRNAMTSYKGKGERYVDKETLQRIQQTGRQEKMEAQQHRMNNRELEEKDRLKKLILNGRDVNLDECPPDMRNSPVYSFWKLVNKEMEKMNRARAAAYYKKYRKSKRSTRRSSHRQAMCADEDSIVHRSDPETPEPNLIQIEEFKEPPINIPTISFQIPDNIKLKYEDEGIKTLRSLMTVQELYQMADKIIGLPREIVTPISDDSSSPR